MRSELPAYDELQAQVAEVAAGTGGEVRAILDLGTGSATWSSRATRPTPSHR